MKFEMTPYDELKITEGTKVKISSDSQRCSRKVFFFDDFVVKFDVDGERYDEQNTAELNFYMEILEKEDEKFFPKLLDFAYTEKGLVLFQERVFDSGEFPTTEEIKETSDIIAKYGLSGDVGIHSYMFNCMHTEDGVKIYDIGLY